MDEITKDNVIEYLNNETSSSYVSIREDNNKQYIIIKKSKMMALLDFAIQISTVIILGGAVFGLLFF